MRQTTERGGFAIFDRRSGARAGAGARRSVQMAIPKSDIPPEPDAPDEGIFDPQRAYLLARFRAFHAELTQLRRTAVRDATALARVAADGGAADADASGATADLPQICLAVRRQLQLMLEKFELDAAIERGADGASLVRAAQYAMAALADEIFLNIDWPGRQVWLDAMLEQAMFGSQIAGEEVFRRIDVVLRERTGSALELASVYYLVLALGFEGQYRGHERATLDRYRHRLYRFLYRADAPTADAKLVPQAYDYTAAGMRPVRLPYVQRWALTLGATTIAYLIAAEIVWRVLTSDVARTTQEILHMAHTVAAR